MLKDNFSEIMVEVEKALKDNRPVILAFETEDGAISTNLSGNRFGVFTAIGTISRLLCDTCKISPEVFALNLIDSIKSASQKEEK